MQNQNNQQIPIELFFKVIGEECFNKHVAIQNANNKIEELEKELEKLKEPKTK